MELWLDVNDPELVIIGGASTSMHIDGVHELFGGDAFEAVKQLKHEPPGTTVDLQIAVLRVDSKDVSGCETAMSELKQATAAIGRGPDNSHHQLVDVYDWMEDLGI